MKRMISLLLAVTLVLAAAAMTGCQKEEKKSDVSAVTSIPEDLTPINTNSDGNPTGYSKFEKDEKGRVTRDYTYDSLGKLQGSVAHEYDDNGFVVKDIRYKADGSISSQVTYERNKDGLETKRTVTNAEGAVTSVVMTKYNKDGSSAKTFYDGEGNVISDDSDAEKDTDK